MGELQAMECSMSTRSLFPLSTIVIIMAALLPLLSSAQSGEQACEQKDFIVLHQIFIRPEGLVFWHAINAAQVAVIGQADA